jgi:cyclophilin family peptidyl-prolyl cis-trans isomerase
MSFFRRTFLGQNHPSNAKTKRIDGLLKRKASARFLRIEPLEDRNLLSVTASVEIGAPTLVPFVDSAALAGTSFSVTSTNPDVTATILHTSSLLKMQVHGTAADNTPISGEMDFLLLDDYAPDRVAHMTEMVNDHFYDGLTFHRIMENFMIQGGASTNGNGGNLDSEFDPDIRFTSSGLLAMANAGPDTENSQFFITSKATRWLDFSHTIIGKLVVGDGIRDALDSVATYGDEGNNVPIHAVIIDSMTIVPNTQYGLLLIKAGESATASEHGVINVTASNGSQVLICGTNWATDPQLDVTLTSHQTSIASRPVFIQKLPDVHTTVNTQTTFNVPVEGNSEVLVEYAATTLSGGNNLQVTAVRTDANGGTATVKPTGGILGVYGATIEVGIPGKVDYYGNPIRDAQDVAIFIAPTAPSTISILNSDVVAGGWTSRHSGYTFRVAGVTNGCTVAIYADGNLVPIATADATGSSVDIETTAVFADGPHSFVAKQAVKYAQTVVGNRTIPAGEEYSAATATPVTFTIDDPIATADASSVTIEDGWASFTVTYSQPGGTIAWSMDDYDLLVTDPSGQVQTAWYVGAVPNSDNSTIVVTYRIDAQGGEWNASNTGLYSIAMQANQVSDVNGVYVADGPLFSFTVTDTIAPRVTIEQATGQADPTEDAPVKFRVVFSEPVLDFVTGDVTLSGTAGATTATVAPVGTDGTTYDVAVSGMTDDGTVIATIEAGKAHDAAGNLSTASTTGVDNTVTFNIPPTVTIVPATGQVDPTNNATINFTVVFSEPVLDFVTGDVTLSGTAGATTATVTPVGTDGTTYDVAVSGMTDDGTVIATIDAGKAHDALGNGNKASPSGGNSVTYDATSPTVTINQATTQVDPTNANAVVFDVVFSEPVKEFSSANVKLSGASNLTLAVEPVGSDGKTYKLTVSSLTGHGTITATIDAAVTTDLAGNPNIASSGGDNTVDFDLVPPSVTINQADPADPSNVSTINFTVVFSEPVTDFATGDVKLSGTAGATTATVTQVGSDGKTYSVAVTGMTGDGDVIAEIEAGKAHDAAGNTNTASTSVDNKVVYDHTAPTVKIDKAIGQADPTNVSTINFTVEFSEPVTDFTDKDVLITGTAGANIAKVTPVDADGKTYTVAVSGMTGDGTVNALIEAGKAHDAAGNPNTLSTSSGNTVTYDNTRPTVKIEQATDQADPTDASTIYFTVEFTEKVTDFTGSDVKLGGTAGATTATVEPIDADGKKYKVTVTGMGPDGTVIAAIEADKAHDAAGNSNTASPSDLDNIVTRNTIPTVTVNKATGQAATTIDPTINFTVVFSEPVTDFATGDVTLTGTAGATTAIVTPVGSDGKTYNVAVTGMTGDGSVIVAIDPGKAHDTVGNANLASTGDNNSVTFATLPSVTIERATDQENPTNHLTINFTVVFSEPVTDFATGDVTITGTAGATKAVVTGSGTTYNVAVSGMARTGTVVVSIPAGVAHDAATNANTASSGVATTVNYYAGPVIANVAVCEAAGPKNGILESNEKLKVTWTATTQNRMNAQLLVIDGGKFCKINGFGAGPNYSCVIGMLSPGVHRYAMKSVDSKGKNYVTTGTFTVSAPVRPTIADMLVSEAGVPKNGVLEAREKLRLAWTAWSQHGIASQTVWVDGKVISTPVNRPGNARNYNCVIGTYLVGNHKYTIKTTDRKGVTSFSTGAFTVVSRAVAAAIIGNSAQSKKSAAPTV